MRSSRLLSYFETHKLALILLRASAMADHTLMHVVNKQSVDLIFGGYSGLRSTMGLSLIHTVTISVTFEHKMSVY